MTSETKTDALKLYWDHFFKAETGTYEKTTWLDLFLAEFLIQLNEGADPKELINFCPVSGVVTLVGCELLCGLHRLTSSINTHCSPHPAPLPHPPVTQPERPEDDQSNASFESKSEEPKQPSGLFTKTNAQSSTVILRKYLLGGIAWRCLVLLKALGVEGLSCCRQLSSVLMWLYGELAGGGGGAPSPHVRPVPQRTPIHQLFSDRIWSKQKVSSGSLGSKVNSAASSDKESFTGRSKHMSRGRPDSDSKMKRKSTKRSDLSSDTGESNDDLQILNRSMTIKVCSPNDDFDYYNSPATSDFPSDSLFDALCHTPRKTKPKVDDYMNDKHREIIDSEITAFDFTIIIIDLLQELCKAESSLSGSEGSQISVQCINFSLRNLCSFQFGSMPPCSVQYNNQEVSRIKVALTELLIVSLDKVLIRSDLCAKLINNGILPMLLRILEDVTCKSSTKYHTKSDEQHRAKNVEIPNKTESENLLKFVFGIAYSVTAFFHCLLMQCRTVDKLREFTDQFKLYGECLKGGLLKECIELMIRIPGVDEDESVNLIEKLIESIGRLVSGMKRIRSEVIHTAACPRSRHKACRARVAAGVHHHHDILGDAGSSLPLSSTCCISILYGTLTSLTTDEEVSARSALRNKTLRVMLGCGVCCCFSPGTLMESVVRLMLTHGGVASLCLQVLEHTIYGELGASVLVPRVTDQLPCAVCEPPDYTRELRSYCSLNPNSVEKKSVWSFLIHYNSLLQLDNHHTVLHATVNHLLRVTPKCRMEMKYELLFSVIYPTFIVAKHRYIIRQEETAYFLTVSCLNIFASLLTTVAFAEQFIQKGGLSYVLELVSISEFSKQCCSILEVAIIVEIHKLTREKSETTRFKEIGSLPSVQMLNKSLSEMTEKCFKIYRIKLPAEKFSELCDVTKESEMLTVEEMYQSPERMPARKLSASRTININFTASENVTEESIEDHIEVLKNVWTFWKSCAGLCVYRSPFRRYLASEHVLLDSYALLKVLLYYVCNCACSAAEMRLLVKITEALLTIQFAVADVTNGKSKETSCAVLRAALSEASGAASGAACGAASGAGLRAVCEALVRVSAVPHAPPAPFARATIPAPSSAEGGSSGEDGAPKHEHELGRRRDHTDDGYEADVEVGRLDLMSSFKTRRLSDALSTFSATSEGQAEQESEWPEDAGEGGGGGEADGGERTLAHPELCVIVIDVITDLIDQ